MNCLDHVHVHVGGGYPPQAPGPGGCPPGVDPTVFSWFVAVDADHSGQITANELQQALTNGNWSHFNPEACRLMIGTSPFIVPCKRNVLPNVQCHIIAQ